MWSWRLNGGHHDTLVVTIVLEFCHLWLQLWLYFKQWTEQPLKSIRNTIKILCYHKLLVFFSTIDLYLLYQRDWNFLWGHQWEIIIYFLRLHRVLANEWSVSQLAKWVYKHYYALLSQRLIVLIYGPLSLLREHGHKEGEEGSMAY